MSFVCKQCRSICGAREPCTYQYAMEMLVLGARVLTVGRPARVKTLVNPFLVVVVAGVRFSGVLSPENDKRLDLL